jgi:hypothetical protein
MLIREAIAGEGAITPHFEPVVGPVNSLVFCCVPGTMAAMTPAMMEQIYETAREWAVLALRPTLFEQAQKICEN